MSEVMNEYLTLIEENKTILPAEIYEFILEIAAPLADVTPTAEERDKYFVDGFEKLSQAVFNFLHSGREYFIMEYAYEFQVNRLSEGFKKPEELVHYAMWVIRDFYETRPQRIESYNTLIEKDKGLSSEEILARVLYSHKLEKEIIELTFNPINQDDYQKRLALIELSEEYETFAQVLLTEGRFYQQLDSIVIALDSIKDVDKLNQIPEPVLQLPSE